VRVVLDPNVLVSALISSAGPSREIVDAWAHERFELVASPALLGELGDVLARPRFRRWVAIDVARDFIAGLTDAALVVEDAPAQVGSRIRSYSVRVRTPGRMQRRPPGAPVRGGP
jgi:putative PIN family toxin of toxin-antitoxin system